MYISMKDPKKSKKNPGKTLMAEHFHIEVKDIAAYCMVSTSTVRRWLKNGNLKAIKLPSNQCRVSIMDFKAFLKRYNIPIREDFFHQLQP